MENQAQISQNVTAVLVYTRPILVFFGMICAITVMWNRNPALYVLGVVFLFTSMTFDLVDGWFAARFIPNSILSQLADRIMDKLVYSFIFPLISVGMMWRLLFSKPLNAKAELLHAIFILLLCVTVIVRDHFAHFMRGFAIRKGQETEEKELTRLRTIVAAPLGAFLYAYTFYIPMQSPDSIFSWMSWFGRVPTRFLITIEIIFLIINFGSIAGYCRKYGHYCLDELCLGDETLRRRILSIFPNALTVMNAMMGMLAVFFSYQGRIREAYLILIGAAIFDKLDGALARKLGLADNVPIVDGQRRISFGGVMDDIADAVSFCIAPAWIFYLCVTSAFSVTTLNFSAGYIALLYATLGIARLIYFTLDKSPIPGFFKGMPTPAAALLVVAPLIILSNEAEIGSSWVNIWIYSSSFLMVCASLLMNLYPIKYIHMGRLMDRQPWFGRISLLSVIVFVFTPYFGYVVLFEMLLFLLSPILTWRTSRELTLGKSPSKAK